MLYRIANKEDIMNDSQYLDENKEDSIIKKYQNRITYIYKKCKYYYNYNTSNIQNDILENYIPNDKDFSLFIIDFLNTQKSHLNNNINIINDYNKNINVNTFEPINDINEDISIYQKKPNINLVFIGNKGSGKSTTIGHLLYDTGNIDFNEFEKIKISAKNYISYSYRYAWIMDKFYHERTYRNTINASYNKFETDKYFFSIIDIPGKKKFIKNATKGIFEGDVAIIIVPVDKDFEKLFSEEESLKDHIIIAYTMGIKQVIVAINKIDICHYSEKMCLKIKEKMKKFLNQIGFDNNNIQYIYYSGITGQNLVNRYETDSDKENDVNFKNNVNKTPWYKGKTLLESLEELKEPKRLINKHLSFSVNKIEKISGVGWILIGIIKTGLLKKDTNIFFSWNKNIFKGKCISIEKFNNGIDVAIPGDIIGIKIHNIFTLNRFHFFRFNKINHFIIGNCIKDLPLQVKEFTSIIKVMNVPNSIKVGFSPILFCHMDHVAVEFKKILFKMDGRTNKISDKNPKEIKNGERAVVLLKPLLERSSSFVKNHLKTFVCEKYNPYLGSFVINDNNKIIAVGKILEINKENIENEIIINDLK